MGGSTWVQGDGVCWLATSWENLCLLLSWIKCLARVWDVAKEQFAQNDSQLPSLLVKAKQLRGVERGWWGIGGWGSAGFTTRPLEGKKEAGVRHLVNWKQTSLLYTVQNITQLGRMHTALRRGKLFQINWQVKAFLHCRLSTLWKRSKNKKQNKTIREVHESNGNAMVMPPSYLPWQHRPCGLQQGRGARATEDSSQTS